MIKNYKIITWFFGITTALFAIFAITDIYYAGSLSADSLDLANSMYITTAVMIIFPVGAAVFYLLQYYYYRDKTVKTKMLTAIYLLVFAILFLVAKPIDASSEWLSEKRLISFITGIIYAAIWITHAIQVFIK